MSCPGPCRCSPPSLRRCHVAKFDSLVGLQQLGVGLDLDLPHVVLVVGEHVPVRLHELLHLAELLEEVSVLAVVEGVEVVLGVRQLVEHHLDLAPPDDLHAPARAVGGGEGGAALLAVQLHHKPSVCTGDL